MAKMKSSVKKKLDELHWIILNQIKGSGGGWTIPVYGVPEVDLFQAADYMKKEFDKSFKETNVLALLCKVDFGERKEADLETIVDRIDNAIIDTLSVENEKHGFGLEEDLKEVNLIKNRISKERKIKKICDTLIEKVDSLVFLVVGADECNGKGTPLGHWVGNFQTFIDNLRFTGMKKGGSFFCLFSHYKLTPHLFMDLSYFGDIKSVLK